MSFIFLGQLFLLEEEFRLLLFFFWRTVGVYLGYFFVVVVSCFIFREYFSTLTCICFSDLVASQDRKFLSISYMLLSPAVGVLHIVFKIFIMMIMPMCCR